jgi:hypothetical protein
MQGVLALLLVCGTIAVLSKRGQWNLDPSLAGALTGAFISGAAILLGTYIARLQSRQEKLTRATALRSLITVELVNVSLGYFEAQKLISTALRGQPVPEAFDFSKVLPRGMPFTSALGTELLLLSEPEIAVLITLGTYTVRTRDQMQEISGKPFAFDPMNGPRLATVVAQDMTILAEAFERIAPERKLQSNGEP